MALFLYPMERETYYSLLMRWMQLYHLEWKEFIELINHKRRYLSNFVDNIDFACLISDKLDNYVALNDFLTEHSLYNLETYFINGHYKKILNHIFRSYELSNNRGCRKYISDRITVNTNLGYNSILGKKFCPKCMLEQTQKYGISWQRIEWIITGLELCPLHKFRLVYADTEEYHLPLDELSKYPRNDIDYSNKKPEFFMENVMTILNREVPAISTELIFKYMLERLKYYKIIEGFNFRYINNFRQLVTLNLKQEILANLLCEFWGEGFIRLHFKHPYDRNKIRLPASLGNGPIFQSTFLSKCFYSLVILLALSPGKNIRQIIEEIQ